MACICEGMRGRRALIRALSWELGPGGPLLGFIHGFLQVPRVASSPGGGAPPVRASRPRLSRQLSAPSRDARLRLLLPLLPRGAPYNQLSPLLSEPTSEYVRPSDCLAKGSGWGGAALFGMRRGLPASSHGRQASSVRPSTGWAGGASWQESVGVLQCVWLKGGS